MPGAKKKGKRGGREMLNERLVMLIRLFANEHQLEHREVAEMLLGEACYGGLHAYSETELREKFDRAMVLGIRAINVCGCGRHHTTN